MKILVADDNDSFLFLVSEMLKTDGHVTLLARDGKEAREMLEDQEVDVIISDVRMPGLDGARFHSYVRDIFPRRDVPFIFVSGFENPYMQQGLEWSANDFFVSKENAADELMGILKKIQVCQLQ